MNQTITEYLPKDPASLNPVSGNIFANDIGSSTVTTIQVQNQTAYTKFGDSKITVQGEHGVLEIDNTGKYTYTPSTNSFGQDKFTYLTTSVTGSQDTAELVFGYSQTVNGDANANVVSSGGLNDTFNLGAGADKLIFNLLDAADVAGGNGKDTWSDFRVGTSATDVNADKFDISALLIGANEQNINEFISLTTNNGQTVVTIDRDGKADAYQSTELLSIGIQNTDLTLEKLLQNGQIIY